MICRADECLEQAKAKGLCWRHYRAGRSKRRRRGGVASDGVEARYQSAWECLFEATLALADAATGAPDDMAFRRAKDRFRVAAKRWVSSLRRQSAKADRSSSAS